MSIREWTTVILAVAVAMLIGFLGSPAQAASLQDHVDWIVAHSDYEHDGQPLPEVRAYPQEVLQFERYGQEMMDLVARSKNTIRPSIWAIYDHNVDAILVSDDLDQDDPQFQAILVHELVHYLQDVNGTMNLDCLARNERPAYKIQKAWADAHGVETDVSGMFDAVTRIMDCDGMYY